MYSESEFVLEAREHFPFFEDPYYKDYILFENAGGSQTLKEVVDKISNYLIKTNVQVGAHYELSQLSTKKVSEGIEAVGLLLNAKEPQEEICIGASASQLLINLSLSIEPLLQPSDEIIVTNFEHEANIGCWRGMAERKQVCLKEWKIDRNTFDLDLDALENLLTPNTRLISFTHCSNILGTINPVKEIVKKVRSKAPNAFIVIDGVAFSAHRYIDVQDLDVDFYVISFYKIFGTHCGALYGKKNRLLEVKSINHFFVSEDSLPYKMQSGNICYESAYSIVGTVEYLIELGKKFGKCSPQSSEREYIIAAFDVIAKQEEFLCEKLIKYLSSKPNLKIIGSLETSKSVRVPTISFVLKGYDSEELSEEFGKHKIATRCGHVHNLRMLEYFGLMKNGDRVQQWGGNGKGVVRISLLHYNTTEEVDRFIEIFEKILKKNGTKNSH